MLPVIEKAIAGTGDRSNVQVQLVRDAIASNGVFNSNKTKAAMIVYGTMPTLCVADPEMTQDLFTKKNSIVDKTGKHQFMFEDLLGKSFVFSKGDQQWQSIRKACAHAFYKERLSKMMLVVKDKVEKWVEKRHKEI